MIQTVAVIGSGTMGNGIAHLFAQHGFTVHLVDISKVHLQMALETIHKNLDRQIRRGTTTEDEKQAALGNIHLYTELAEAVRNTQLVIEAVSENMELKTKLFSQLDELTSPGTILATNTSSISITKIAAATKRPHLVIGMHFMNPVPVMKLVEVITGYSTASDITTQIIELSWQLQKVPCVVNDYPGFIANRILMPLINEAIYSLYEGVAGVEEIDTIMKLGMAHPMGPLQLADFIGLDICLNILNVLQQGFGNPKYAPCPLLINMVAAGKLGSKSGEGFYLYDDSNKNLQVSKRFSKISP